MKKFRKLLFLAIIFVMTTVIVGCGGGEDSSNPILYDFDQKVDENMTLIASWKKKIQSNVETTITSLAATNRKPESLYIDNITKAKKEIKDFDVVSANPTLQTTAVNGKCSVEWRNKEVLNSIIRDVNDVKVNLTAVVACGNYTYQTIQNGIVTIISVLDATDYTISNDSTTAKYLVEAEGAQVLTTFHNDGTSYLMWFNDVNTKFVVKEGA